MAGTRARPPAGGTSPSDGPDLTHREAPLASMLDGLHQVAQSAEMPFLAYLIDVAREEANSQKAKGD
jgi:hypothetical protein